MRLMEGLRRRCSGRRGALGREQRSGRSGEQLRPWERGGRGKQGRWQCSTRGEAPTVVVVHEDAAEKQIDAEAEIGEDGGGASERVERERG
jgi:hypothetical protein